MSTEAVIPHNCRQMQVPISGYQVSQRTDCSQEIISNGSPPLYSYALAGLSGQLQEPKTCGSWIGESRKKLLCLCFVSSQSSPCAQKMYIHQIIKEEPLHFRMAVQKRGD